jgi:hypothetical protein
MKLLNDSLDIRFRVGQGSDVEEEVQFGQVTEALQRLLGLSTTDGAWKYTPPKRQLTFNGLHDITLQTELL